jgi:hypothetical protein
MSYIFRQVRPVLNRKELRQSYSSVPAFWYDLIIKHGRFGILPLRDGVVAQIKREHEIRLRRS